MSTLEIVKLKLSDGVLHQINILPQTYHFKTLLGYFTQSHEHDTHQQTHNPFAYFSTNLEMQRQKSKSVRITFI